MRGPLIRESSLPFISLTAVLDSLVCWMRRRALCRHGNLTWVLASPLSSPNGTFCAWLSCYDERFTFIHMVGSTYLSDTPGSYADLGYQPLSSWVHRRAPIAIWGHFIKNALLSLTIFRDIPLIYASAHILLMVRSLPTCTPCVPATPPGPKSPPSCLL